MAIEWLVGYAGENLLPTCIDCIIARVCEFVHVERVCNSSVDLLSQWYCVEMIGVISLLLSGLPLL